MDFQRDRSSLGVGGLVTSLEVTLARIKVLAHLRPQSLFLRKSPGRVGSGLKNRMRT